MESFWDMAFNESKLSLLFFNASFDMMKLDGSYMHKHTYTATISAADFDVTGKTSTSTYYDTATIFMEEGSIDNSNS
jgi:hypothetical protein